MSALVLRGLVGLGLLTSAAGCREGRLASSDRSTTPGRTTTVEGAAEPAAPDEGIAAYDLASPPSSQVRLPAELREISGGGSIDRGTHPQPESLAFLPDGTLLVASKRRERRGRARPLLAQAAE